MNTNISGGFYIKGAQAAAVVFLIISVFFIWQIIDIYPETGILGDKLKAMETEAKNAEDNLNRLKEFLSFTAKNEEVIRKFDLILPDGENKPGLVSGMDGMARTAGLSVSKIVFAENGKFAAVESDKDDIASENYDFGSMIVKMSLRGGYYSLKNFLAAIEKNLQVTDVLFVDFIADSSSKEAEEEKKTYTYNIDMKVYFGKAAGKKNAAELLASGKFNDFTVRDMDFTKEKSFNDLFLFPDYNINIGADEIGKQNIF